MSVVSRIRPAFDKALESGSLLVFPSSLHRHEDSGIQFELRLCPALQHKPTLSTPHFERTLDYDPFAPPYTPQLLVGELKDDNANHVLLLNKYAVVPRHFLLVTKDFQSQSSPLLPPDLLHSFQLLLAALQIGEKYFAFYNCGSLSGASQPHKHIQFIPVEEGNPPIEKLAKSQNIEVSKPFSLGRVPYTHFAFRLPSSLPSSPPETITEILSQAFLQLIDLAVGVMRRNPEQPLGPPSYNVLLTMDHLHVIPRSKEEYILKNGKGSLSVNALGYAGMLLVKNDEEMEEVKQQGLINILKEVGLQKMEEETEVD